MHFSGQTLYGSFLRQHFLLQFFVGTNISQIYRFDYAEFRNEMINTCHNGPVNDVAFPL